MATTNGSSEASNVQADGNNSSENNPYGFSQIMLNSGIELYGARIGKFPVADDPVTHVKNIRALKMREDDIIVAAFPKCGTHWLWEVTQMLVNQSTEYEKRTKEHVMLEFCKAPTLDVEPSPRIFNSHLWMSHMPQEIITKKPKIIHVVRNPKDTLISFFFHMVQIPDTKSTFENFMKAYMRNDVLTIQHQFNYLRQMKQFEKDHPDVPIKLINYEEMKADPVKTIKKLAEFLEVPVTDAFCEDVALACSFDKMKAMDESREIPESVQKKIRERNKAAADIKLQLYRKGIAGDWKNHLTVAQNEIFDEFIARETAKGLDYTFIYE